MMVSAFVRRAALFVAALAPALVARSARADVVVHAGIDSYIPAGDLDVAADPTIGGELGVHVRLGSSRWSLGVVGGQSRQVVNTTDYGGVDLTSRRVGASVQLRMLGSGNAGLFLGVRGGLAQVSVSHGGFGVDPNVSATGNAIVVRPELLFRHPISDHVGFEFGLGYEVMRTMDELVLDSDLSVRDLSGAGVAARVFASF